MRLEVLLMVVAALQEPGAQEPVVEVAVERLEITSNQGKAASVLMAMGAAAGRCVDHLPGEARQAFDDGLAALRNPEPGTSGPGLADVVFLDAYGDATAMAPSGASREHCSAELADYHQVMNGHREAIESLVRLGSLETTRPWERLGHTPVAGGPP